MNLAADSIILVTENSYVMTYLFILISMVIVKYDCYCMFIWIKIVLLNYSDIFFFRVVELNEVSNYVLTNIYIKYLVKKKCKSKMI